MGKIFITKKPVDPFLNNVSLLLPFDNNFQDFSNNNFAVTANGNVQISSAQSKFGGASAYFDGSGDYIEAPVNAGEFGSGDFTIECWINADTTSSVDTVISKGILSTIDDRPWTLEWSDGRLAFFGYDEVSTGIVRTNNVLNTGTWYHIAVVKQGSTFKMFLDGIEQTNHYGNPTTSTLNTGGQLFIGTGFFDLVNRSFHGYIDDLRITKGVARYTTNFIPPGPLFNIGKLNIQRGGVDPFFNNMSLLLPMNTSFADFSSNNFALTVNGNAEIRTDQKKFGDGAGYFGSSSDYLTASSSSLFGFGTGDFTIEMWIYPQGANSFQGLFNANDYTNGILIRWHANSTFDSLYINGTAYDWDPEIYAPVNTWSHVALVRYSGTVKMFVNGVNRIGSVTNNSNIGSSAVPLIGASAHNVGEGFNGYIDDIRVTKGIARYTTDFTPPNVSFPDGSAGKVNISKPVFPMANLLAFWRLEGLTDSSGNGYTLTNNGSVQFVAGKIGNAALGDGQNYLTAPVALNLSNQPYTFSFWINLESFNGNDAIVLIGRYPGFSVSVQGPDLLRLDDFTQSASYVSVGAVPLNTWTHLCITKDASQNVQAYFNGQLDAGTGTTNTDNIANFTLFSEFTYHNYIGRLDALGVWSRVLAINEVKTLYNNGVGLEP